MTKIFASLAMAGLMAGMVALPVQAQSTATKVERSLQRGAKTATSGEAAPLKGAMTQAQARRVCQQQLAGTRESKSAIRTKMRFCINEQMQGR